MNREIYLKRVKKNGGVYIGLGIFISIISILMIFAFIVSGIGTPVIIFILLLALGIFFIVMGSDHRKGENARYIKKHPKLLELADSLSHPLFENDFIIISDKAIYDKKNFRNLVALEDVLAIYEHIVRTNGIVSSHSIQLCSIDGNNYQINVYGRKRQTKEDLVLTISGYCPDAIVGYSPEVALYVYNKRKEYKNKNKTK